MTLFTMMAMQGRTESMEDIRAWRADPPVGLEARRQQLVHEGWDRQSAETAVRWNLAYRKALVVAMEGRESTKGVSVSLADVKAQMAAFAPYPRKTI